MAFKGITAWLLGGDGGGGGTVEKDYQKLNNKPSINGHVLIGNQSSEQLGIDGTNVVANPEEEATDVIEKITIGNDTYNIPSGGGIVGTYNNENLSIT